jgi:curved DNA-binding protein CbpA
MENCYDLLGISPNATAADIKTAYRREAMKWHPDRNGGSPEAAERFKQIQMAFYVLSRSRAAYDARLNTPQGGASKPEHDDIYSEAYEYWRARERGDLSSKDFRWRSPFRGGGVGAGIGGVIFIIWILIQILRWIFPNGL